MPGQVAASDSPVGLGALFQAWALALRMPASPLPTCPCTTPMACREALTLITREGLGSTRLMGATTWARSPSYPPLPSPLACLGWGLAGGGGSEVQGPVLPLPRPSLPLGRLRLRLRQLSPHSWGPLLVLLAQAWLLLPLVMQALRMVKMVEAQLVRALLRLVVASASTVEPMLVRVLHLPFLQWLLMVVLETLLVALSAAVEVWMPVLVAHLCPRCLSLPCCHLLLAIPSRTQPRSHRAIILLPILQAHSHLQELQGRPWEQHGVVRRLRIHLHWLTSLLHRLLWSLPRPFLPVPLWVAALQAMQGPSLELWVIAVQVGGVLALVQVLPLFGNLPPPVFQSLLLPLACP